MAAVASNSPTKLSFEPINSNNSPNATFSFSSNLTDGGDEEEASYDENDYNQDENDFASDELDVVQENKPPTLFETLDNIRASSANAIAALKDATAQVEDSPDAELTKPVRLLVGSSVEY
jgi:hypothetical protein